MGEAAAAGVGVESGVSAAAAVVARVLRRVLRVRDMSTKRWSEKKTCLNIHMHHTGDQPHREAEQQ